MIWFIDKTFPCTATTVVCLVHLVWSGQAVADVEAYSFPAEAPEARDFEVEVVDRPVFVYDTKVAAIATFGISDEATVRVARSTPFKAFTIRPVNAGISARQSGDTIEFTLSKPTHLSIEFDGDIKRPLYVFANPPEARPTQRDNLRFFKAGKIHRVGRIDLADGEAIYIEGGAIVQAYIRAEDAEKIRILGPGILDASHRVKEKTTAVLLRRCRDVDIDGTLILDSFGWTVHLSQCDDVRIANMKQVGWRANSDGIDIEASKNVRVVDSFLRNADDCVAVKSKPKNDGRGLVTDNVLIENTVFWNSLPGNAMEIGFELCADAIRGITFRDCDIVRVERGAAFSIHNGDNAVVENVLFDDIRVEDVRGDFADMYIGLSIYSGDCPDPYRRSDPKRKPVPTHLRDPASGDNQGQWIVPEDKSAYSSRRGYIRNVTFRNIQFFPNEGDSIPNSLFVGYDDEHSIDDITFDGIFVNGRPLKAWPEDAVFTRHARNIQFLNGSEPDQSARERDQTDVLDQRRATYTPDDSVFPNPERGWFIFHELKPTHPGGENRVATAELLETYHARGYRLAKHILKIPTTEGDMLPEFLAAIQAEMDLIRQHGFKVFYRFNYNWDHSISKEDATLDVVLRHLEQLRPILHRNKDVLAWLEIGFIGYWGEMHSSTSGHIVPRTVGLSDSGKRIVGKILDVLPKDRVAGVRYPNVIYRSANSYGSFGYEKPLDQTTAYSGSNQSRLAAWYANFGAGEKLWHKDDEYVKNWAPSTQFVPMWAHCDHFQTVSMDAHAWREDARVFHYVALSNPDDEPHTLDIAERWRHAEVHDDFAKKLGYRYRLSGCRVDHEVAPGQDLAMQLRVHNDGWARPVNPRIVEIILRDVSDAEDTSIRVQPSKDFRLWFPGAESEATLDLVIPIPTSLPFGDYELLLSLPAPEQSIRDNPDFSIRLAHMIEGESAWEPSTGYNRLGVQVSISNTGKATPEEKGR